MMTSSLSVMQKMCGDAVVKGGGVKLTDVNPHLVCVLCHGYFVDATSIVECLHSFCRSCIVLHLDKKSYCPICRENIHNSKALKPDKALQDIVYKLVPGLFHSEMKRRQEFYQKHLHRDMHLHPESRGISVDRLVYTAEELISLSLEYYDKECEQEMWKNVTDDKGLHYIVRTDKPQRCLVRKRYLKCPAAVRMSHLKKFIRLKYNLKPSDLVELLYRRESLPEEYSIMDIAYIYTWNRNEPMRFFYKINARVTVPVMPVPNKCFAELQTDVQSTGAELCENSSQTLAAANTPPPPPQQQQVKFMRAAGPSPTATEATASDAKRTAAATVQPADLLMKTQQSSAAAAAAAESQPEKQSKTEFVRLQDHHPTVQRIAVKKERQPVTVPPVPLNPPISPEGTSRKENVPDNVRNSCTKNGAGEPTAAAVTVEEKKPQQNVVEPPPAADVPMKRLEKLVDQQQQQQTPVVVTTGSSTAASTTSNTTATTTVASAVVTTTGSTAVVTTAVNASAAAATSTGMPRPLSKKPVASVGESKLNLSISKLIMKNQNAAAAAAAGGAGKFVPTLQQMQQIGMHTSIPNFQQQQQQQQPPPPPSPSQQPANGAYVRPGYHCIQPSFKRTGTDAATPVRSQAPTNRPPFIPVRKSYEWNKARNLASKPAAVKDAVKPNNEKPTAAKKKTAAATDSGSKSQTCVVSAKNSDEMNAAQSLLRVGHDLWLSSSTSTTKPQTPPTVVPLMADLHGKYNCESSLQITKVTEPETNQPQEKLQPSSSQPSLQIMRVPPAADKSTAAAAAAATARPTIGATDTAAVAANSGVATTVVTATATTAVVVTNTAVTTGGKPVNKKPVPSLYSMPTTTTTTTTKRPKEHQQHNVVSPHLQDNKRVERRVDTENGVLSVSLLTETSKQDMDAKRREVVQPDVSIKLMTFASAEPAKKTPPELNAGGGGGGGALINNKRKLQQDESNAVGGACSGGAANNNKRKPHLQDESTNAVVVVVNNKRKPQQQDESGTNNKRKQDDAERKVTPPRPAAMTNCKDDVPQLIEINSSPYAKLLPAKKQQPATAAAAAAAAKHQPTKLQQLKFQQPTTKHQQPKLQQQPVTATAANVLDLSKSPPNGGAVVKQLPGGGRFSPVTGKMTVGNSSPVQYDPSTMAAATSAAINSNLLFAAQRQAAAFLLKRHFDTLNNGLMRNGGGNAGNGGGGAGKGPTVTAEWPRAMFNPALFARPPSTNLNN